MYSSDTLHPLFILSRVFSKRMSLSYGMTQTRFDLLKHAFTHALSLAFTDYSLPFTLFTDGSALAVGAVLMQQNESSCPQVIACASRTLNGAESHYSVTHVKAVALVWSLCNFRHITYGNQLILYTKHAALLDLFKG